MALSGTFSGTDTVTAYGVDSKFGGILNTATTGLVVKGVYSGGRLSTSGGSVTVTPFLAMTSAGMTVTSTAPITISLDSPPTTTPQYIVCQAQYNASGAAVISVYATHTVPADTLSPSSPVDYIVLGIVGNYTTTPTTANLFYTDPASVRDRDQVTPVQDSHFLGHFNTQTLRNNAYNSTPYTQRIGDMTTYGTSESTFTISFWDGSSWQDFTNATQVAANLATHIADYTKHITLNQGAALVGSAGTPSGSNPYVTSQDPGILGTAYVNALTNALGGSLSGSNPVLSQNLVIAVPRVYQVGMGSTTNKVTLSALALSISDFVVYLGKQGNTTYSSATQYFAIEDEYGNGYISTVNGLPVYVVDVCDYTGAISLNPSAIADVQGFYDVTNSTSYPNNTITLILNTSVAVGVNLSVRMNVKGHMSSMSPNWPGTGSGSSFSPGNNFLPAITAFRQGKVSYVSALEGDFNTITVGTASGSYPNTVITTQAAGGSPATPGYVTQSFYAGPSSNPAVAEWSVATNTVGSIAAGTSTLFAPVQYINYDQLSPFGTVSDGVKFSSAGIQSYQGVWVTDQTHTTNLGGIDPNGRIMATQGDAAAPGYYFAGETTTGNTTTTSATTLVLTSASFPLQYFIGTSNQLVTLPVTSTLNVDQQFIISNNTTASTVTVQNSALTTVGTVAFNTSVVFTFNGTNWTVGPAGVVMIPGTTMPTATGIYYIPTYQEAGSSAYNFNLYNGIGFSLNGKTALFISRNGDTGPVTDMDCPLTLVQDYESGTMNYYLGIANVTGSGESTVPGAIMIGSWANLSAFNFGLTVDIQHGTVNTPLQFQARNTSITNDEAFPAYSFTSASSTGIYYVDNWTNGDVAITVTSSTVVTLVSTSPSLQLFNGSTLQTVVLPFVATLTLGQVFSIANNSTANITVNSAGGYFMAGVGPGVVMAFTCISLSNSVIVPWSWVVTGPASTAGQYTNGIGFSIGGRTAFMIMQDQIEGDVGITSGAANPLILSQSNDGTYVYYDFAVAEQASGDLFPGAIRFGSVPYSGTFRSLMSVTTRTSSVDITGYVTVTNRIITGTNSVLTGSGLTFTDIAGSGVTSNGTSLYLGNATGANVQVTSTNTDIYSPIATTVHGTNAVAVLNIVNSSDISGTTGTIQTNGTGMLLGYGTVVNDGTKIQWGTSFNNSNGYLSTSGRVFASSASTTTPSYSFNGYTGVGMGVDGSGYLHLYGNGNPIVIENAQFASGSVTGTLTVGSLISTTSVTAVTGSFSGDVVINTGTFSTSLTSAFNYLQTEIASVCNSYVSTTANAVLYGLDGTGTAWANTTNAMIRIATLGTKCFFVQVAITFTGTASGGDHFTWAVEVPTTGAAGTLWNALHTLGGQVPFTTAFHPQQSVSTAGTFDMYISANGAFGGIGSNLWFHPSPDYTAAGGSLSLNTLNFIASGMVILP
jgi:hypothetical protein